MPYISEGDRDALLMRGMEGASPVVRKAGELNYLISSLLGQYLTDAPITYERINTAIGALEAAKLELYRRIVAPYENEKLTAENDVYLPVIRKLIEQRAERAAEQAIAEKAAMQDISGENGQEGA